MLLTRRLVLSFLTISFLLVGAASSVALANLGSQYVEQMLSRQAYQIPAGQDLVQYLDSLVLAIELDSRLNPSHKNINHVLLGDAFHWLGHIYEDRFEFQKAWPLHLKSYEHYSQSSLRRSAFISNLETVDHAKMHLMKVAPRVQQKLPVFESGKTVAKSKDQEALMDPQAYQQRVQDILDSDYKSCTKVF